MIAKVVLVEETLVGVNKDGLSAHELFDIVGGRTLFAGFKLSLACLEEDDELLALQMIRVTLQADRLAGLDAFKLLIVHEQRFATAWISGIPKARTNLLQQATSVFAICRLG